MRPPARLQAAIELLDEIIIAARDNGAAADAVARKFFAKRRYAGSKDRRAIRNLAWDAIRHFGERPKNARAAFAAMADRDSELAALFDGTGYGPAPLTAKEPRAAAGLFPNWIGPLLYPLIDKVEYPALLERAPLDVRVNRQKVTVNEAAEQFEDAEILNACSAGFRLPRGFALEQHPLYLNGEVDVQDMGSQIIADICGAVPEMTIVDLCAGAGGKTLALAETMAGRGRLIAADTNRNRLQKLPQRAQRSGVGDIIEEVLLNAGKEQQMLTEYEGIGDVVLVDAPCSGSGTWRRNPETRWRLTPDRLDKLLQVQANLLGMAARLVKPGGSLVYAVCSLIQGEGDAQIADFVSRHSGWEVETIKASAGRECSHGRLLTPAHDGSDGFFFARLKKSC